MSHNAEHESYATTEILKPRAQWIEKRRAEVARTGDRNVSQMHFARRAASPRRWSLSPSGRSWTPS